MKLRTFFGAFVLSYVVGCSSSDTPTVTVAVNAAAALPPTPLPAATLPSIAPPQTRPERPETTQEAKSEVPEERSKNVSKTPPEPVAKTSPADQTLDIGDLFAPPKEAPPPQIVKVPEPQPVVAPLEVPKAPQAPPPPLRLIGFSESETPKAILSVNGKLNLLGAGESVEGIELVSLAPPTITLKHGENEFEINLIEQPWIESEVSGDSDVYGRHRPGMPPGTGRPMLSPPGSPRLPRVPSDPTRTTGFADGKGWAAAPAPPSPPGATQLPTPPVPRNSP